MNTTFKVFVLTLVIMSFLIVPAAAVDLNLNTKSALLMEASTGKILYEQNSNEKHPIASVTKVMTMLLIMEALDSGNININDNVMCSEYAASMGGSQVFLEPGETMTVHDMLKAIAVASGNDASVAMAEYVAGAEGAFVDLMNKKAAELGMTNTNFMNCNGLDQDNHYSSAHDVALMSQQLLKHPKIHEYLGIWMDSLRDGAFGLANTNKLIRFYSGANGIKTGSTDNALFCISASAKREDMQLISVVLGAPTSADRFNAASTMLDYGFANFYLQSGVTAGTVISELDVLKGMKSKVRAVVAEDKNFLAEKSKKNNVEKKVSLTPDICAPVEQGQKVGEMSFWVDGQKAASVDIVAEQAVEKVSVGRVMGRLIQQWID